MLNYIMKEQFDMAYNHLVKINNTSSSIVSTVDKTKATIVSTKNTIKKTKTMVRAIKSFSKKRDLASFKSIFRS